MTSEPKSIRTPTCSAQFIASNDDLLTQILLPLPIKSIVRFKLVSKHWLSLISTSPRISALSKPVFALLMHRRNDSSHLDLIPLLNETTPPFSPFRSLAFLGEGSKRRIESCNALFLCYQKNNSKTTYHVFNPTTDEHVTLPPAPPEPRNTLIYANIAFDPFLSPHYNVVFFQVSRSPPYSYSSPYSCQVVVYSSETHEWRQSRESFEIKLYPHTYNKRVFWNNAIHWMTPDGSFRFDIVKEKMIENPMPPITADSEKDFKYFDVICGHLYLINGSVTLIGHLNIYRMESDCSCWCLVHHVDVSTNPMDSFPDFVWRVHNRQMNDVLFLAIQESFLVVKIANQVIRYNFKRGTFRKICDLPYHRMSINISDPPDFGAFRYFESLSSVR